MTTVFTPYELLKSSDLNAAFAQKADLATTNPQSMNGDLTAPNLTATNTVKTGGLEVDGNGFFLGTGAVELPVGTTAQRPFNAKFGAIRANSLTGSYEVLASTGNWVPLTTGTTTTTTTTMALTTQSVLAPVASVVAPSGALPLSLGSPGTNAVPVSWSPPSVGSEPFDYVLDYRRSGTTTWTQWGAVTTATSATVGNLDAGVRYDFQVTASNESGELTSLVAATATLMPPPSGPLNVVISQATDTSLTVSWQASVGAVAYQVQYAPTGAAAWVTSPATEVNSYVLTGLQAATTYSVQVLALTTGGGVASTVATGATVAAAASAVTAPTGLTLSNLGTSSATVSWTGASESAVYQVQIRKQSVTGPWYTYTYTPATFVNLTDLDSGRSYQVQISAANSTGSATSSPITFLVADATATQGTVAGNRSSGIAVYPLISGPSSVQVAQGAAIALSGVTADDPVAAYSPGSVTLTITAGSGTITLTDDDGNQIVGSGTKKISFASTMNAIQSALSTLIYTATQTIGLDSVTISVSDMVGQSATLVLPITVSATNVTATPPPPTNTPPGERTTTGQPTDTAGVIADYAADVLDRIGVNVQFEQARYNNGYDADQAVSIENMLNFLGAGQLHRVREPCFSTANITWLAQVAANCGPMQYQLCVSNIRDPSQYPTALNEIEMLMASAPTYVAAIEGVDAADTSNNLSAASTFQSTVYAARGSLPCVQLSVESGFTANPNTGNYGQFGTPPADVGNAHTFPPTAPALSGTDAHGMIYEMTQNALLATPGRPVQHTAVGWPTYPVSTPAVFGAVDETVHAAYVLMFVMAAFKQGVQACFLKELLDDPNNVSKWGLFHADGTPKAAAVALRNVFQLLTDTDHAAMTFVPGKLNYTVSNVPAAATGAPGGGTWLNSGYQDVVFQKANGAFYIVMWNEQQLNDTSSGATLDVANHNVTVTFTEASMPWCAVYDPIGTPGQAGAMPTPIQTAVSAASITVALPPRPIILEVIHP